MSSLQAVYIDHRLENLTRTLTLLTIEKVDEDADTSSRSISAGVQQQVKLDWMQPISKPHEPQDPGVRRGPEDVRIDNIYLYSSGLLTELPRYSLTVSNQLLNGPPPNVFQQMSRHPLQLRLSASKADSNTPSTVDMYADALFRGSSDIVCRPVSYGLTRWKDPERLTVRLASAAAFSSSSACVSAYIWRKCWTAARDSLVRCKVLKSATTSERCNKSGLTLGLTQCQYHVIIV